MNTNDIHQSPPFPLIHVDLNRDPNPSPDFFFPVHHDQDHYPHPANSVDELIIARGGRHCHPPSYVIEGDRRIGDCDNENGHDLARDPHHHHEYCSVKWMSSKMRIMKKMTTGGSVRKPSAARKFEPDIKRKAVPAAILENDDSSNNSNRSSISGGIEINNSNKNQPIIIRVCSDCNTTKTPLWRSGPRGPKSLCNACGIRQRKARRAMALAAAAANGEPPPYTIPDLAQKAANKKEKKRSSTSENKGDDEDESDLQPKKKRKRKGNKIIVNPPADPREICFEEFRLRLSDRISGVQGMFPQDEKEAAILLMALSYGLVQS